MQDKQIILFLRKKTDGQNSIEELAYTIAKEIPGLKIKVFPEYGNSIKGIMKNILFAMKNQGEVNHLFCPSDTYIGFFIRGKRIITWHDTGTLFQSPKWINRFFRKILFIYPSIFFDVITCISNSTKKELLSFLPQLKHKIRIIHNPINQNFTFSYKDFNKTKPTILHLGTNFRKNLENTIKALKGINCHLHIIGKLSQSQLHLLYESKIEFSNEVDIEFETIIKRYRECDIVSFPSLYEGFGMPIIEGNATGKPILTSARGAIPEIASDCVLYVDPEDVSSIREGFLKLINDDTLRSHLIKKGLENVKRFKLDTIVNMYYNLYLE